MDYFVSCEGDTEKWYLEWLQNKINGDTRTKEKVKFIFKNIMPSSFAKSNAGTFTKAMIAGTTFCRIQDIEDYSKSHIESFYKLLKSNKTAKQLFKQYNFVIGYSNYTFEVWIIAHKTQVKTVIDRSQYYKQINYAYNMNFIDNDDYKHEKNFKSILKMLSLDDVIQKALPECVRFKRQNRINNSHLIRQTHGFSYILSDPDTTLDDFIKAVLINSGIIQ